MRFVLSALAVVVGPFGATLIARAPAVGHALGTLSAALPDAATAAVMFAGLGLVAGARRARTLAVAD